MFHEHLKMNRYIKLKVFYAKIVWILYCSYKVFGCTSTTPKFKQIGDSVTLQFQATTTNSINSSSFVSNVILSNNGSTLLAAVYRDGVLLIRPICHGCTITGNATTGDLSITLDNLQKSNSGTYKFLVKETIHEVKGCIILYILGKPEKPTIQSNNNNSMEGMNVKLTCTSRSTTYPSDPNLNLQYDWRVDTEDNPKEYEYSQTKNILTIKNLQRKDAKKRFTCKATESGPSVTGLTSNYSDEFMINVFYSTQKEFRESDTEGDAYNSWMIVGIAFGFLAIAIGFYATGITILWRKAVSKGVREPTGESTAQTTYVNTDVAAQHVEVDSTQDQHITEAESVNLYTDLAHYSKDDKSTYEVLKGN